MNIVSFDPGKTTGVVVAHWESGRHFDLLLTGVIPWNDRFTQTKDVISHYKPEYIVIESFRLYPHKAQSQIGKDFPSAQMIGIIETYAHDHGLLAGVRLQPANVRSSVKVIDDHKRMVGASPHVNDAYRHLRYYIIVNLPNEKPLTESGK